MSDQSHSLESHDVGTALIIDGTKLHYSEPFEGYRVSVVAFMHKATMDLSASQLGYLRWLGFNVPATSPCDDLSHGAEREYEVAHCSSCMAYWSDSGALRLPGYGGEWDDYGPKALPGAASARGLTPGPSCMHVDGHPRYEGTLSVRFNTHDEWHYVPPSYGDLGQRSFGSRRSRR